MLIMRGLNNRQGCFKSDLNGQHSTVEPERSRETGKALHFQNAVNLTSMEAQGCPRPVGGYREVAEKSL